MRFLTLKSLLLGAMGLALLTLPTDALRALGLGEARVGSYLGQPLDISVRLLEADEMALDTLTVAPATPGDHERLGVPADALSLGLEITIDRRVDPPQLRIRSRRSVNDPVVQVLVDARWSSGRVLREYTLFLDPPLVDVAPPRRPVVEEAPPEAAPEPVERPVPARPAPAPAPAPRPAPTERPDPVVDSEPVAREGVVGPIGAGETLWGVAMAWRPDTSLTMSQVMLAIFERNPQAFIGGNVNRLRRGAELTMPDVSAVRATSAAEADRRIREQMQVWQQEVRAAEVPVVADAAVPAVERAPEPEPEPLPPEVVHRLEVVPPEQEGIDDGPVASPEQVQEAGDRLRRLEDQMYADELETDLFYRDIESIRSAIESGDVAGLAIADEEMALFEMRLREARRAREEAERQLAEVAEADETVALDQTDEASLISEPAVVDEPPAVSEAPTAELAEPQAGWPIWLWAVLVLGVLLIVAILGWLFLGRGRTAPAKRGGDDAGIALTRARARVASRPEDLAAHLALLRVLADKDDTAAFSAALDDMYKHVDDDNDAAWQQALTLAASSAPDHPLLTPPETARKADDDEDGLDDRTREMLGILEQDSQSADDYEMEAEIDVDDDFDADRAIFETDEEDERSGSDAGEPARRGEEIEGVDLDLAELSERLDEDEASADSVEEGGAEQAFDFDFSGRGRESDSDASEERSVEDLPFDKAGEDGSGSEVQIDDADMGDFERDLLGAADALDEEDLDFSADDSAEPVSSDEAAADPDEELEAFLRDDDDRKSELDSEADSEETVDEPDGDGDLADDDAEVKLDLARAYLSMDDPESAQTLLEEILAGGSARMKEQARKLLDDIE